MAFLIDIIVGGFEDSVYEVSELDSILTVHAVQIADIERDVIVTLTTQSQTAIGECVTLSEHNNPSHNSV